MGLAECYVSCNRIQAFFELSEKKCLSEEICADETERSISLNKVTCYWSNGESNNELLVEDNVHGRVVALSNVSLLFQQGNLYCIIGKIYKFCFKCNKNAIKVMIFSHFFLS